MVGLGETSEEIEEAMHDIRGAGVDVITFGQYLRPTRGHLAVERYVEPAEFTAYKKLADAMGFRYCASGPMVRSSYRAGEAYMEALLR